MKSIAIYYVLHIFKFFAVSYIFYRLGKKFHAPNPFWHYYIPVWNYVILCQCTGLSTSYAIYYHLLYFLGTVVQVSSYLYQQPTLVNIWLCLFAMCIIYEVEIFGRLAVKVKKDFWLYGFSGFVGYFPLIFLILTKTEPVMDEPKPPLTPTDKRNFQVY